MENVPPKDLGLVFLEQKNKLFEKYISSVIFKFKDDDQIFQCLLGYRVYSSPLSLLKLIKKITKKNKNKNDSDRKTKISRFVLLWVTNCSYDFSEDRKEMRKLLKVLETLLGDMKMRSILAEMVASSHRTTITTLRSDNIPSSILNQPSQYIARSFCVVERKIFLQIKPSEFYHKAWQQPERSKVAAGLTFAAEHFDKISYWTASKVLTTKTHKKQAQVLEKMIEIMAKLTQMRNYNSAMQILAGLSFGAVRRLKSVWKKISQSAQNSFTQIDEILSPSSNHKNYRERLSSHERQNEAIIPYVALFLRDFTFVFDGNHDFLPANDGVTPPTSLNLEKIQLCSELVARWKRIQENCTFAWEADPAISAYLIEPPGILTEVELYQLSFESEPVAPDIQSMILNGLKDDNNILNLLIDLSINSKSASHSPDLSTSGSGGATGNDHTGAVLFSPSNSSASASDTSAEPSPRLITPRGRLELTMALNGSSKTRKSPSTNFKAGQTRSEKGNRKSKKKVSDPMCPTGPGASQYEVALEDSGSENEGEEAEDNSRFVSESLVDHEELEEKEEKEGEEGEEGGEEEGKEKQSAEDKLKGKEEDLDEKHEVEEQELRQEENRMQNIEQSPSLEGDEKPVVLSSRRMLKNLKPANEKKQELKYHRKLMVDQSRSSSDPVLLELIEIEMKKSRISASLDSISNKAPSPSACDEIVGNSSSSINNRRKKIRSPSSSDLHASSSISNSSKKQKSDHLSLSTSSKRSKVEREKSPKSFLKTEKKRLLELSRRMTSMELEIEQLYIRARQILHKADSQRVAGTSFRGSSLPSALKMSGSGQQSVGQVLRVIEEFHKEREKQANLVKKKKKKAREPIDSPPGQSHSPVFLSIAGLSSNSRSTSALLLPDTPKRLGPSMRTFSPPARTLSPPLALLLPPFPGTEDMTSTPKSRKELCDLVEQGKSRPSQERRRAEMRSPSTSPPPCCSPSTSPPPSSFPFGEENKKSTLVSPVPILQAALRLPQPLPSPSSPSLLSLSPSSAFSPKGTRRSKSSETSASSSAGEGTPAFTKKRSNSTKKSGAATMDASPTNFVPSRRRGSLPQLGESPIDEEPKGPKGLSRVNRIGNTVSDVLSLFSSSSSSSSSSNSSSSSFVPLPLSKKETKLSRAHSQLSISQNEKSSGSSLEKILSSIVSPRSPIRPKGKNSTKANDYDEFTAAMATEDEVEESAAKEEEKEEQNKGTRKECISSAPTSPIQSPPTSPGRSFSPFIQPPADCHATEIGFKSSPSPSSTLSSSRRRRIQDSIRNFSLKKRSSKSSASLEEDVQSDETGGSGSKSETSSSLPFPNPLSTSASSLPIPSSSTSSTPSSTKRRKSRDAETIQSASKSKKKRALSLTYSKGDEDEISQAVGDAKQISEKAGSDTKLSRIREFLTGASSPSSPSSLSSSSSSSVSGTAEKKPIQREAKGKK